MLKHRLHYSLFVLRNSDFIQRLKSSLSSIKSFLRNIIKITAIPLAVPTTRIISEYPFLPDYLEFDYTTFEYTKQRFNSIYYRILDNYLIIGRKKRLILFNKIILFTWLKRY
jgi:hypothetical protein